MTIFAVDDCKITQVSVCCMHFIIHIQDLLPSLVLSFPVILVDFSSSNFVQILFINLELILF